MSIIPTTARARFLRNLEDRVERASIRALGLFAGAVVTAIAAFFALVWP